MDRLPILEEPDPFSVDRLARIERALGGCVFIVSVCIVFFAALFVTDPEGGPILRVWFSILATCGLAVMGAGELTRRFPGIAWAAQILPLVWIGALSVGRLADVIIWLVA